jgi:hypothetical protein
MFSSFLEYQTMDKVQKPSNSECYTPSESKKLIVMMYWFGTRHCPRQETTGLSMVRDVK